jgi:hypothetical protein
MENNEEIRSQIWHVSKVLDGLLPFGNEEDMNEALNERKGAHHIPSQFFSIHES